jgi:hypothetical protein
VLDTSGAYFSVQLSITAFSAAMDPSPSTDDANLGIPSRLPSNRYGRREAPFRDR